MNITKEIFIQFLKDNDFYDAWMEGYKLDNDMYQSEVPLNVFFEKCPKLTWLYHGISGLAMIPIEWPEGFEDIKKRFYAWRDKNLSKYMELDEKWMDFVHTHQIGQVNE